MILSRKSDLIGSFASGLCLIHCIATPTIFMAQALNASHNNSIPVWWGLIDYLLIVLSFIAVFWSSKTTVKLWMGYALWINWFALFFIILNEKLSLIHLSEMFVYFPALGLVILHLYNNKYCKCSNDQCCKD